MSTTNKYNLMHHSFVSPMRGGGPGNLTNISQAAVPTNERRDMSSSPYMHKKRNDVSIIRILVVMWNNIDINLLK